MLVKYKRLTNVFVHYNLGKNIRDESAELNSNWRKTRSSSQGNVNATNNVRLFVCFFICFLLFEMITTFLEDILKQKNVYDRKPLVSIVRNR